MRGKAASPASNLASIGEIVFPELVVAARGGTAGLEFERAQLDAADFAGDRFRQVGKFEAADSFVGAEAAAAENENFARQLARGLVAWLQGDEGFRDGPANFIGAGDNGCFCDCGVLDERAFKLKGTEAIVRAFEDVVRAADVG